MAGLLPQVIQNLQGLQGLQSNKAQMQDYEQQKTDMSDASNSLRNYYKTGNQEDLINATLKSPQLAQQVLAASGLDDKRKQQAAASDLAELWQLRQDPQAFQERGLQRVESILARKGYPQDTINLMMTQAKDPAKAEQIMRVLGAGLEAQGYKTGIFGETDSQTPSSIKELEYYEKLKEHNPEAAAKFAKAKGYVDTPKEQALTPQERNIAKYQEMVSTGSPNAEAFGRSAGILSKEGQTLSATTEKALQDSIAESELNSVNTTKYLDLASRFKESDIAGGILGTGGSWREALKSAVGSQDEVSKIVGDWTKIRSGEAIASLPQGPATDADIRLALKPLPENANAEYMDKYLRGLAKIAEYKSSYNQAKADFISENGSLRANGKNFGSDWNKKRADVLKQINGDSRFKPKRLTVEEFTAEEKIKTPQGNAVGRFTVEVEN